MSVFNVELVKKVDDSYDIEIGFGLMDKLVADLSAGLAGSVNKFVVVTDSNVEQLYAKQYIIRYWMQDIRRISLFFRQEKKARPGLPKNL